MRNYLHCFARVTKQLFATTLFLFLLFTVTAQKKISGVVTGSDAKPAVGVTVSVKGTKVATSTSADGTYTLDVPANGNTLVFSSVGFEITELAIGDKTTADVALKER